MARQLDLVTEPALLKACPQILGFHLEGPFLCAKYKVARPEEYLRNCDLGLFEALQRAARGKILLTTISPELKGAADFTAALSSAGVRAFIGHKRRGGLGRRRQARLEQGAGWQHSHHGQGVSEHRELHGSGPREDFEVRFGESRPNARAFRSYRLDRGRQGRRYYCDDDDGPRRHRLPAALIGAAPARPFLVFGVSLY